MEVLSLIPSLWRTTSRPRPTAIGRRWCWTGRKCRSTSWTQPGRRTTRPLGTTTSAAARASSVSSPSQKWSPLRPQPTSGTSGSRVATLRTAASSAASGRLEALNRAVLPCRCAGSLSDLSVACTHTCRAPPLTSSPPCPSPPHLPAPHLPAPLTSKPSPPWPSPPGPSHLPAPHRPAFHLPASSASTSCSAAGVWQPAHTVSSCVPEVLSLWSTVPLLPWKQMPGSHHGSLTQILSLSVLVTRVSAPVSCPAGTSPSSSNTHWTFSGNNTTTDWHIDCYTIFLVSYLLFI